MPLSVLGNPQKTSLSIRASHGMIRPVRGQPGHLKVILVLWGTLQARMNMNFSISEPGFVLYITHYTVVFGQNFVIFCPLSPLFWKYICFMFLIFLKVKHSGFSMLLILCDFLPFVLVLMFNVLIFFKVKHSVLSMLPLALVYKHTVGDVSVLYLVI